MSVATFRRESFDTGAKTVKRLFRVVLPALCAGAVLGCGSDEPALKELSAEERAKQTETQRKAQEERMKGQMDLQKNSQYKSAGSGAPGGGS